MFSMKDVAKPCVIQSFLIGVGVAALGYLLAPRLKKKFQPVIDRGTQGAMALGSKTKELFVESKEKMANKMSRKSDQAIADMMEAMQSSEAMRVMGQQREMSEKIITELKDAVTALKDEISQLKNSMASNAQ